MVTLYLSSDLFHHERQERQPPLPAHGERSWGYRQADSEGRPVWVRSADRGVWGVQRIISTVRAHSVLNNVDQIWISTATRGVQDVSTMSSVPVEIVSKWWWVDQMVFTTKWSLCIIMSTVLGGSVKLVCTSECPLWSFMQEVARGHLRADFWVGIASCCILQWKFDLELRCSTNATTVAVAKITGERGWRVEKKCLCIVL